MTRLGNGNGLMQIPPEPEFSDDEMRLVLDRLITVEKALCTYDYLQRSLSACDVVASREYRTAFNGFYRMRQRPPRWYEVFFSILQREKRNGAVSFGLVLKEIFDETGRIEASFCSKLVATINPNLPVWDRHVLGNLGLKRPPSSQDSTYRLRRCIEVYTRINTWSSNVILREDFGKWRSLFDDSCPQFRYFTDIKKLDLFLWQSRS